MIDESREYLEQTKLGPRPSPGSTSFVALTNNIIFVKYLYFIRTWE